MQELITTVARLVALENGAAFAATPYVTYDHTDSALGVMADALLSRTRGTGIRLLSLARNGSNLVVAIDDTEADEPLCPSLLNQVVRECSYRLLGEVWDGLLAHFPAALTEAPEVYAAVTA